MKYAKFIQKIVLAAAAQMRNASRFRGVFASFFALLGATPMMSLAQVWSTGPDGQMGYYGTPSPVSPQCILPRVWTLTNGHYSCQQPPQSTCPAGQTQTSAPVWTGSGWSAPGCALPSPPPPPPPPPAVNESQACAVALTESAGISPGAGNYNQIVNAYESEMAGPRTGQGMNAFNSVVSSYSNAGWLPNNPLPSWSTGSPGAPSTNDMYYINNGPAPLYCWVQPGTNNVTGLAGVSWCSPNGGSSSCGGGGYGN